MRGLTLTAGVPFLALVACVSADTTLQAGNKANDATAGNGVITVSDEALFFNDMSPEGYSKSVPITVSSTGENPLQIYSTGLVINPKLPEDAEAGVFFFEDVRSITLQPGEDVTWNTNATTNAEGQVEGALRIESNDADHSRILIPLCAKTTGSPTNDACPADGSGGDDTGGDDTADSG